MSKILYVTNQIPFPPDNGVRIVSHNAMRLISLKGHEIALAVLTEEIDSPEYRFNQVVSIFNIKSSFFIKLTNNFKHIKVVYSLLKGRLFFVERHNIKSFRKLLSQQIYDFKPDVIHFDLIPMCQYYDIVPKNVRKIASINDSYSLALENEISSNLNSFIKNIYRKYQLNLVRKYESITYSHFDYVHTMTEIDAEHLNKLNPKINIYPISNGVDDALFNISDHTFGHIKVLYVANLIDDNLIYLRNFLEQCWPFVLNRFPNAKLDVVGRIQQETTEFIKKFGVTPGVSFKGYVTNIVDAYIGCGISIVPINKNCGIVNKAIEAMAAGLAVVGFDKTFQGIKYARNNVDYLAVDDFISMGQAIADLMHDNVRRLEMQKSAHAMAKSYYSWDSRANDYEIMYFNNK